jgi:hypothetical protein
MRGRSKQNKKYVIRVPHKGEAEKNCYRIVSRFLKNYKHSKAK